MQLEQMFTYISQNIILCMTAAFGILLLFQLFIFLETVRTKRELHGICKRIRRYFDVILQEEKTSEEETEDIFERENDIPVYTTADEEARIFEERKKQEEFLQRQKDAKLIMDVIQDVF